jgi:calmodulin
MAGNIDQLTDEQVFDFSEAFFYFASQTDASSEEITTFDLQLVMRCLGQNPTQAELDDFTREFDSDGRGVVSAPPRRPPSAVSLSSRDSLSPSSSSLGRSISPHF